MSDFILRVYCTNNNLLQFVLFTSPKIMKRALDAIQQQLIERKMFLYVRFDCFTKQQFSDLISYVQKNVVAKKMKIEYDPTIQVVLNEEENDYQFIHNNITVPIHLTDLQQQFPVKDFSIPFMMHMIPKTNQIVLIFNHIIADAQYIFNLITNFEKNQQLPQELFDSPCSLLKPEILKYKAITQYIEPNSFKIPDLVNKKNCHICRITYPINDLQFMKQQHTQRMEVVSILLKLRLLQKEELLNVDQIMDWLSKDGINAYVKLVADLRPYVKQFKTNCGNFISFYYNSCKLRKDDTLSKITQILKQQLNELKEQSQYLEGLSGMESYAESGMLKGLVLSSFGTLKTPFKKVNLKQFSYDDTNNGLLFLYSYTIDDYLTVLLQYNDQQASYKEELRSWLTTLVQNCKDDVTIEQLYRLIQ